MGLDCPAKQVALSYSGSFAVTAGEDGTGRLWETDSGKCRCVLRGHEAAIVSVMLLGVAVSSSGSGLGHVPGTVSPGGEGETQLAAGKAGTLGFVVTASIDCTARVWNPESGEQPSCPVLSHFLETRLWDPCSAFALPPPLKNATPSLLGHTHFSGP